MVSTPNAPGGLFERIEKEPGESCLYRRLKKDYNYGLGRIYTVEEIEKAKQSPGFGREYELQYLGRIGNVFNSSQIDKTIELGERYKAYQQMIILFTASGLILASVHRLLR